MKKLQVTAEDRAQTLMTTVPIYGMPQTAKILISHYCRTYGCSEDILFSALIAYAQIVEKIPAQHNLHKLSKTEKNQLTEVLKEKLEQSTVAKHKTKIKEPKFKTHQRF